MDEAHRSVLLRIAREAIRADLAGEPPPPLEGVPADFPPYGGAFVSLHNRGALRGCIGTFYPDEPLPATIQKIAVESAHDPRFIGRPVRLAELPDIDIEISVLSEPVRTTDPLSLELGKHGIYIRRGLLGGCFLPQVATEHPAWTKEEFLTRCCRDKAGLPPHAWRDPDTEVLLFTAEVFGEGKARQAAG